MGHIVIKIVFPITKIAQIFFGGSWVLGVTFKVIKKGGNFFSYFGRIFFCQKINFLPWKWTLGPKLSKKRI
jgi:hypothetical protein